MIDPGAATRSLLAHLSRASGDAISSDGRPGEGASPDGEPAPLRPPRVVSAVSSARLPTGGPAGGGVEAGAASRAAAAPGAVGLPVVPTEGGPTHPEGLSVASPQVLAADASVRVPTSATASTPGVWSRLMATLARVIGGFSSPEPVPPPSPAEVAAIVARAVIHELSPPNVEAALLGTRAPEKLVRPVIATVAFAARARLAWHRASEAELPLERARHVAEGLAWTERASRAARALQRALPPATEDDRALRALLRTGLGALQERALHPAVALESLRQVDASVRAMADLHGIPLTDPVGPLGVSGRTDVPGFLARLEDRTRKTLLAVLVFALPVIAFGLVYLAAAG